MPEKMKSLTIPAFIFSLLGVFFAGASFLTLYNSYSGFGSKIIFFGSLLTTVAAICVPILSLKCFKLNSYHIKIWSLFLGSIALIVLFILYYTNHPFLMELELYSQKGLIWGLNTALLLFNLTYMEIENNDLRNQEHIKFFEQREKELKQEREERLKALKEVKKLKEQMLKDKQAKFKGDE